MAILNILSFSTLLVFAKAAYIDIGPCPPMPAVVSPFDVERVNMALLIGKLVKFTFCFSSTQVIGTLSGQHQSPTYLKGTNVPVLSMDPSSREQIWAHFQIIDLIEDQDRLKIDRLKIIYLSRSK